MTHDAGTVTFYRLTNALDDMGMPKPEREALFSYWFGELSVYESEYYNAAAINKSIDRRIEIWQDRRVVSGLFAIVSDGMSEKPREYNVGRTHHRLSKDGLPVTEITLEEPGKSRADS